jgi:hypothetical protein
MKHPATRSSQYRPLLWLLFLGLASVANAKNSDPLPSWNNGAAKSAIIQFVQNVTKKGGEDFVPAAERIATFDNDGTLWTEHPMTVQMAFALERVRAEAPKHSEWKELEPFKSVLANDMKGVMASGEKGLVDMIVATHTGMSVEEFNQIANYWLTMSKDEKFKRPHTELVYQPMLELLNYLRANGFKTYIVSGGGVEFMRPWTEKVYGIPPEQVIGSSIKTKFEIVDDKPVLMRLPEIDFIDDKDGKPVGIQKFIGRRPIAAFGNSDGDLQMLEWTTANNAPHFALIVHHTDAEREYAYDKDASFGRLDKALTEASQKGWTVVDMKNDWKRIFSFEK